ncbi:MAG: DUF1624 domain-containing protein [Candidatus Heimdallarchaeota archaeon]|nr:DUF1624 domain-containing protein [Candidatus Heimdallarchaeota archaeon]
MNGIQNENVSLNLKTETRDSTQSDISKPRRYVTLDFLRGLAILGMISIHLLTRIMDLSWTYELEEVPVFFIILTIILVFLGSWRGLFVLISGIGHMIAMQRARKKGVPLGRIVFRQVTNGIFLLMFAMLTEGIIGYDGWLNRSILNGSLLDIDYFLGRLNHFHTIHSIAWCLIINGILYGILMWKTNYKKITQNVIIYSLLAILVFSVTTPIWNSLYNINPDNNHYFTNWLTQDFWYAVKAFFAAPLGGSPQPLFPYISTLFVGNVIGLYLEQENPPKKLPAIGMMIGGAIIIIGIIYGLVLNAQFEDWLPLRYPERLTKLNVWQPWYLFGLGGQLIFFMLMIRFVEYRGKAESFAKRTAFVRRLGIIPFTIYAFQWIELLPQWIISGLIFGLGWSDYDKVSPLIYLLILAYVIGQWYVVTLAWEKIKYIGSLEWLISRITLGISKIGKRMKNGATPIRMGTSKRNMRDLVHNVDWINLSHVHDKEESIKREKRLLVTSSVLGIIFFPLIPASIYLLSKKRIKKPRTKGDWFYMKILMVISYSVVQFLGISIYLLNLKGLAI